MVIAGIKSLEKRGVSSILTLAFIILGTIIGVVLLWVFVNKSISRGGEVIDPDCFTLNLEMVECNINSYCSYASGTGVYEAQMLVKRNVGQGNVTGLRFVFENSFGIKKAYDEILSGPDLHLGELESLRFEQPRIVRVAGYQANVKVAALIGEKKDVCPIASLPQKCDSIGREFPSGAHPNLAGPSSYCCQHPNDPNYCYDGTTQGYGINAQTGQLENGYPPGFQYKTLCCINRPVRP